MPAGAPSTFGRRARCSNGATSRWLGVKNGTLLKLIADSKTFDVFVTMDKNLPQQQKITELPFALAVLRARTNRFEDTKPLMEELIERLSETRAGQVLVIGEV